MGDDLMMLAAVVVAAGAGFYLLTKDGNFSLGPAEGEVVEDPGFVEGEGGAVSSEPCTVLCQAGRCAEHAAKYCSGCSKCPNALGKSPECAAWCKASNCVQYRSQCNGTCSNCDRSNKCSPCRKGYEPTGGPGCTCRATTGATFKGYAARANRIYTNHHRSYTGRVTFNESAPIANPNSIPMSMPKPTTIPPQRSMFTM